MTQREVCVLRKLRLIFSGMNLAIVMFFLFFRGSDRFKCFKIIRYVGALVHDSTLMEKVR